MKDILNWEDKRLQHALDLAMRHGRVSYTLISEDETSITIRAKQLRNPNGNHLTTKQLIEAAHSVFDSFTSKKVHIRPIPYEPIDADRATPAWIQKKLKELSIGQGHLAKMVGVSKSDMSNMMSGRKVMGRRTQAALYYALLYLEHVSKVPS